MTTRFAVGTVYYDRSDCDFECRLSFKVIGRTDDTITAEVDGMPLTKRIYLRDGVERCNLLRPGSGCKICSKPIILRSDDFSQSAGIPTIS